MNSDNTLPKITNESANYNFDLEKLQSGGYVSEELTDKNNKSKIFIIAIVVIILLLIIAVIYFLFFNNQNNIQTNNTNKGAEVIVDENLKDTVTKNDPIILQFWGAFLDKDVVQPLIDKYNKQNPLIDIEYIDKVGEGSFTNTLSKYKETLDSALSKTNKEDSIDLPDIFMVDNSWAGLYEDFTEPASASSKVSLNFDTTFYKAISDDFKQKKNVIGVPLWIDNLALIYNKKHLEQKNIQTPPENWIEFREVAETLTLFDEETPLQLGFSAGTTSNVTFWYEIINLLMLQNDVLTVYTPPPTNKYTINNIGRALESFDFYKSFIETSTLNQATWSPISKSESSEFLEGDLSMMITTSWRLREILKLNESLKTNIDIGITKVPRFEGQLDPDVNFAQYWGLMVSKNRPNKSESWKFLEWLMQPDQLIILSEGIKNKYGQFGIIYPRVDMAYLLEEAEYLRTFSKTLNSTRSWYQIDGSQSRKIFRELLSKNNTSSKDIEDLVESINDIAIQEGYL